MQRQARAVLVSLSATLILGCESKTPVELTNEVNVPSLAKGGPNGGTAFATRAVLPPLKGGAHGEAYAIDRAGTLIGGYSYAADRLVHPATWSLVNGNWQVTALPWTAPRPEFVQAAQHPLTNTHGSHSLNRAKTGSRSVK
jgi:hypothetical protein